MNTNRVCTSWWSSCRKRTRRRSDRDRTARRTRRRRWGRRRRDPWGWYRREPGCGRTGRPSSRRSARRRWHRRRRSPGLLSAGPCSHTPSSARREIVGLSFALIILIELFIERSEVSSFLGRTFSDSSKRLSLWRLRTNAFLPNFQNVLYECSLFL